MSGRLQTSGQWIGGHVWIHHGKSVLVVLEEMAIRDEQGDAALRLTPRASSCLICQAKVETRATKSISTIILVASFALRLPPELFNSEPDLYHGHSAQIRIGTRSVRKHVGPLSYGQVLQSLPRHVYAHANTRRQGPPDRTHNHGLPNSQERSSTFLSSSRFTSCS